METSDSAVAPLAKMVALLPCPFCGSDEITVKQRKTTMIECEKCGVVLFNFQDGRERDPFAAWNRRVSKAV